MYGRTKKNVIKYMVLKNTELFFTCDIYLQINCKNYPNSTKLKVHVMLP